MMKLKERPATTTKRRRRRTCGSAPAPRVSPPSASPPAVRRVLCESDEALSIALDRMIDDVLRRR